MNCLRGALTGESPAPAKHEHIGRGEPIEPALNIEKTPRLLTWRKLVCESALTGLPREVATGSEVVELDDAHVLLRPLSQTLLEDDVVRVIDEHFARLRGSTFKVQFTEGVQTQGVATVSLLEKDERRQARLAMISAFRSDPIVQECVRQLGATVDETSVRVLTKNEIEELDDYARKHPGSAGSGSKDAEKR